MRHKRVKPEPATTRGNASQADNDGASNGASLDEAAELPASLQHSQKRLKQESVAQFRPRGQILKIKLRNFMTYGDVTVVPGALLNLVLGPNGTGKSSLVNAVCLGLGGSTSLLGRADKVSEFVRKGQSEGQTEIHLSSGAARPVIITRKMNSVDNSSKWLLNNLTVTKEKVLETVAALKIQVDNLCQFLPQDKVVMFARLTPTQLLMETEKAIGSGELWDLHQQLTELTAKQAENISHTWMLEEELEKKKRKNGELERDVQRFKERAVVLTQVETLNKKLPWARFETRKAEFRTLQAAAAEKDAELQTMTEASSQQMEPLQHNQEALQRATQQYERGLQKLRKLEKERTDNFDAAYKAQEDMEDQQDRIMKLETESQIRANRIASLQTKVAASENNLAQHGTHPEVDPQYVDELKARLLALGADHRSAQAAEQDVLEQHDAAQRQMRQIQEQLQTMDDQKAQRLRNMERFNPGITEVVTWISANKDLFEGQVLGPIACEVECNNPLHQDMLEQSVSSIVWRMFVTESKLDQDKLIAAMASNRWRYRPSISNYVGDLRAPISHPKGETETLQHLGVDTTLDQVFEAPSLVKRVICDEAAVNETYICTAGSEQHVDALAQRGIMSVWLPDNWIRTSVSAYNQASTSKTVIPKRRARDLSVSAASSSARNALANQLQDCHRGLEQLEALKVARMEATRDIEAQREEVRRLQNDLVRLRNQHERKKKMLEGNLNVDQRSLAAAEARPDPKDSKAEMQAALDELAAQAVAQTAKSVEKLCSLWKQLQEVDHLNLHRKELELIVAALQQQGTALDSQLEGLRQEAALLQRKVDREMAHVRSALAAAEAATGGKLSSQIRADFEAVSHLGSSAEEIEESVARLRIEADAIVCNNPHVMEEYQRLADRIAVLEAEVARLTQEKEKREESLALFQGQWLPQLKSITERINTTFGRIFAKIGCAGEVSLHLDERDYRNCSMNIKVKFREEEELQTLNAQRQSGGERSVCTVLYLVALQDVAACPFRIVDEINQGMDQYNERKVFMELVSAATGEGTPQSFLLTPKLLPGLPFSPAVTVLQIMNGHKIADVANGYTDAAMLQGREPIAVC